MTETLPAGLAKMREPFAPNQISKLPKPTKAQTEAVKADYKKGHRCQLCGQWHHPDVVHLDYVGHAALTDRLLDCDPFWTWEPFSIGQDGLPAMDRNGGLWIRLTVCGVTKNGYGDADGKTGGNAVKEAIGDALRNAGMRFGAALGLWHKGDLHTDDEAAQPDSAPKNTHGLSREAMTKADTERAAKAARRDEIWAGFTKLAADMDTVNAYDEWYALKNAHADLLATIERDYPKWWNGAPDKPDFVPMRRLIEIMEARIGEDEVPY